jgi:ornithine cyclodeaminase
MLVFDAKAVHEALPWPALIEALRKAHEGEMPMSSVVLQDDPKGSGNLFVTLPGWIPGGLIGVKMVGVFSGNVNLDPPQPSVQGLVAAFDGRTGAPRMVADGAAMTARKTAGDSALGSFLLARTDAKNLLVVGAGALAPHVAHAHSAARPSIQNIAIWNRTPARAESVASKLREQGLNATAATDLDTAVSQADVISCVTMSDAPLVKGALLLPGAHLDLIGGYLPTLRETDDDAMRRGSIFVDTRRGMEGAGDLAQPVANGAIAWTDIRADLFQLVQGQLPGRQCDEEITVYKNVGGAHLDLFTAAALLERLA